MGVYIVRQCLCRWKNPRLAGWGNQSPRRCRVQDSEAPALPHSRQQSSTSSPATGVPPTFGSVAPTPGVSFAGPAPSYCPFMAVSWQEAAQLELDIANGLVVTPRAFTHGVILRTSADTVFQKRPHHLTGVP